VFARLSAHPEPLVAEGPGGKSYAVTLDRNSFAMALRNPLYQATARGQALAMIHDVAEGRLDRMGQALLSTAFAIGDELSVGAYLSIACTESVRGVTQADMEAASHGTFLGTARAAPVVNACRFWPAGVVPPWLHEPVDGDMPALLFGGTIDPATPLAWMEKARSKLRNAQAVIIPGAGHDVGGECADAILSSFLDRPFAKVDTGCVKPIVTRFDGPVSDLATPSVTLAAEVLDRYTGRFAVKPTFVLTVVRNGATLVVEATDSPTFHLDAISETKFRFREIDATIEFEVSSGARAQRLVMHEGEDIRAERVP
jgi:hypothetical protein